MIHERLECEVLQKARYINTLTFTLYLYLNRKNSYNVERDLLATDKFLLFSRPSNWLLARSAGRHGMAIGKVLQCRCVARSVT